MSKEMYQTYIGKINMSDENSFFKSLKENQEIKGLGFSYCKNLSQVNLNNDIENNNILDEITLFLQGEEQGHYAFIECSALVDLQQKWSCKQEFFDSNYFSTLQDKCITALYPLFRAGVHIKYFPM